MELRQLEYFVAVAQELHFGRAAELLHLSQPALSKQIQALEDSLEIQLFDRTKHWVRLTLAGQKFLEIARNILDEVAEGIALTKQVAAGTNGKLRIGFTESTLFSLAPKIVSTYRQQYPQVELTLTSGGTETQVEALRTHQIDVGFVYTCRFANRPSRFIPYLKKLISPRYQRLIDWLDNHKSRSSLWQPNR